MPRDGSMWMAYAIQELPRFWLSPTARGPWVYFIQGDDGGPIKIGTTSQLLTRLARLQTAYPFGRLRIVGLMAGGLDLEALLHQRFEASRIPGGEWFRPTADLVKFIHEEITVPDELAEAACPT